MSTSILLVPTEAHREALLKGGVCGSRPPLAYDWPDEGWVSADQLERRVVEQQGDPEPWNGLDMAVHRGYRAVIVLAWHGEEAEFGIKRLETYASSLGTRSGPDYEPPSYPDNLPRALRYAWIGAHYAEFIGLGRVVVLDV